jgi:serine acetyltransferase
MTRWTASIRERTVGAWALIGMGAVVLTDVPADLPEPETP